MRRICLVSTIITLSLLLSAAVSAQTSYHVYVFTDRSSYSNGQTIGISGGVHPLGTVVGPGPDTAVFLRVFNPTGTLVAVGDAPVNATTGAYTYSIVAGGTPSWVVGTYTVNATWGAYPPTVYGTTTFAFTVLVSSTTTTSSTTSTTTTSSSTTTITSPTTSYHSSSTSTSTSSNPSTTTSSQTTSTLVTSTTASTTSASTTSSGAIPEFPYQLLAIVALTSLTVVSYLYVKRRNRRGSTVGPSEL